MRHSSTRSRRRAPAWLILAVAVVASTLPARPAQGGTRLAEPGEEWVGTVSFTYTATERIGNGETAESKWSGSWTIPSGATLQPAGPTTYSGVANFQMSGQTVRKLSWQCPNGSTATSTTREAANLVVANQFTIRVSAGRFGLDNFTAGGIAQYNAGTRELDAISCDGKREKQSEAWSLSVPALQFRAPFAVGQKTVSGTSAGTDRKVNSIRSGVWVGSGPTFRWELRLVPPMHRYEIEIRAWIPFAVVVDPLQPTTRFYPDTLVPPLSTISPNCYRPTLTDVAKTNVTAVFRGDGHIGFEGSYRMAQRIEFAFDNREISNFAVTAGFPHVGTTHRDKVYYRGPTSAGDILARCSNTGTAPDGTAAGRTGGNAFSVSYRGANPLISSAPSFAQHVTAVIDSEGRIDLSFTVTNFPSHAIRVTRDGAIVLTATTNDVTCLSPAQVTGYSGAARVFYGLKSSHSGVLRADPKAPRSVTVPSELCSRLWLP
jgi:hypothetical protein